MTKYVRNQNCKSCGGKVVYDDQKERSSCQCGGYYVPKAQFLKIISDYHLNIEDFCFYPPGARE